MPNFATGLAQGLFGAINDQNQQAKKMEVETRNRTLSLLGGLLDQVDDESKPILFQQMADVAGLKGKHRGLWDELTGKGRNEVTDAINQKYGDVMASLVGPGQMERLRPRTVQVDAPGPGPDNMYVEHPELLQLQTPDMSKGRIGLRSPLKEKMQEDEARIRLQQQYMSQRMLEREEALNARQRDMEEFRQANRIDLEEQRAHLKGSGEVLKRATLIAAQAGRGVPNDADRSAAAEQIATEQGLKVESLRGLIGLNTAKTDYFTAQAQAAGQGTGGIRPGQQATLDQAQQQNAQAVHGRWLEAKSKAEKSAVQADQLRTQLENLAKQNGLYFDSRDNTFRLPGGGFPSPYSLEGMAVSNARSLVQEYLQAMAGRIQAESEQRGHYNVIKSNYPDYFEVGDETNPYVKPNAKFGGVSPFGAPRTGGGGNAPVYDATGPYTGSGGKPGNIADMQLVIGTKDRPASMMRVGQLINQGGVRYRVAAVVAPSEDQPYGAVQLEVVK